MENKADIGLIGLAVMGENLVLNMESKGFTAAVYNRTVEKVDNFIKNSSGIFIVALAIYCFHLFCQDLNIHTTTFHIFHGWNVEFFSVTVEDVVGRNTNTWDDAKTEEFSRFREGCKICPSP